MNKPISTMVQARAMAVDMDATIADVEEVFRRNAISALLVNDAKGKVVGIISVRDLAQFRHDKRDPARVRAWEICTYNPLQVAPDTPISEVAALMVASGIHHVLVADQQGAAGIVSALDFVKRYIDET